jgi:hypothetical protein
MKAGIFATLATLLVLLLVFASASAAQEAAPDKQSQNNPNQNLEVAIGPPSKTAGPQVRAVRLSEVTGQVDVYRQVGDAYENALLNLPITQGTELRTRAGLAEVEFEDGSTLRMTPDTIVEFTQLDLQPSGATATSVNVERGEVYVDLSRATGNAFTLAFAHQKAAIDPGSRIRLYLLSRDASLAILKGRAQIAATSGLTAEEKNRTVNFVFKTPSEVVVAKNVHDPYDDWDEAAASYHKSYTKLGSYGAATRTYGIADMNYYGKFIHAGDCGVLWRPYFASTTWDPFANGSWVYYQGGGYSWVSPYPWGWTPYHYGRWQYCPSYGWGWRPYGTWRSIQNPPRYPGKARPYPPRPPVRPIPRPPQATTGALTVVTVNRKPPAASGVNDTNRFIVRRDSAGLGVPRETLGNLNHISEHMDQQKGETMTVRSPAFNGVNASEHGSAVASARGPGESMRSSSYAGHSGGYSGGGGSHESYSSGGGHSSYSGAAGAERDLTPAAAVVVVAAAAAEADVGRSFRIACSRGSIYRSAVDFPALAGRVKLIVFTYGGVTASTGVIAVKRHTGVRASVIVRKNTIANTNLAYAA